MLPFDRLRLGLLAAHRNHSSRLNTWHQFEAPDSVCVLTATPQPTEHLRFDVEDPRTVG